MKFEWVTIFSLILAIHLPMQKDDWLVNTFSLKIIVLENEQLERYEFYRPNQFFYLQDEEIHTGLEAKNKFDQLFQTIQLTEKTAIESLVSQLKNHGYENLNRVEIRWVNAKNELHTWVWDSEQTG